MRMWVSIISLCFLVISLCFLAHNRMDQYYEQEEASTFTLYKIAIGTLNCYISITLHRVLGLRIDSSSPLTQASTFLLLSHHCLTNQGFFFKISMRAHHQSDFFTITSYM